MRLQTASIFIGFAISVLTVLAGQTNAADWQAPVKPKRTWCRTLTVVGQLEPGTDLTEGTTVWPVYRGPASEGMKELLERHGYTATIVEPNGDEIVVGRR